MVPRSSDSNGTLKEDHLRPIDRIERQKLPPSAPRPRTKRMIARNAVPNAAAPMISTTRHFLDSPRSGGAGIAEATPLSREKVKRDDH